LKRTKVLHPQTNLPTRRPSYNPVLARVKDRHSRDSGDALAIKLGELVTRGTVDVDEAVHISDAETLNGRLWVLLPLGAETIMVL
jgi:hypothetical protein